MSAVDSDAAPVTVAEPDPPAAPASSRFAARLGMITSGALVLRFAFTYFARGDQPLGVLTDNRWYFEAGQMLARGDGFGNPLIWYSQDFRYVPSAGHPPLYPMFLGLISFLGIDTPLGARLATALVGVATVVVLGLVARDLAGERAGLIAAGLAAVYPNLWINDGALLSETLYVLFIALFLLTTYRCWTKPTYGRVAIVSVVIALAVLTRSEALVLYPLCVVPLVLRARGMSWRGRWERLALAVVVAVAAIGPWVAYNNQPGRFERSVLIVAGSGIAMSYGNCDETYSGELLGFWAWQCGLGSLPGEEDETLIDAAARGQSLEYTKAHLGEQPKVLAARVGRLFHLYRPGQSIELDDRLERRGLWPSRLALAMYYSLTLLAIGGAVLLWRRKLPVSAYVAVTASVVMSAALTFGITRYRVGFDAAAVVLAAVAIDALVVRWRRRHAPVSSSGSPDAVTHR